MGREYLIAVIGVTGAGKTTFISKATGKSGLKIGHGIDSCTDAVEPHTFALDNKTVTLIDTPGFDDTYQSDADILEIVAEYMASTYARGVLLTGLIFLQPINGNRIQGSEMKRTRLFKKILGEDAYSRVVIGTTMWNQISDDSLGENRSGERAARSDIWGDMVGQGARVVRHDDTRDSALAIVRMLTKFSTPIDLQFQRELKVNNGQIGLTSAGKQLDEDLSDLITALRREIEKLRNDRDATRAEIDELRGKISNYEGQQFKLGNFVVDFVQALAPVAAAYIGALTPPPSACVIL